MALDKQVQIYGIDTGNFYTNREARLHWKNHKIKLEKRNLKDKLKEINKKIDECDSDDKTELEHLLDTRDKIDGLLEFKNKQINKSKQDLLLLLSNKTNETHS